MTGFCFQRLQSFFRKSVWVASLLGIRSIVTLFLAEIFVGFSSVSLTGFFSRSMKTYKGLGVDGQTILKIMPSETRGGRDWYQLNRPDFVHNCQCFLSQFKEPLLFKSQKPVSAFSVLMWRTLPKSQ